MEEKLKKKKEKRKTEKEKIRGVWLAGSGGKGGKSSKGRSFFWRGFAVELKGKERTEDENSAK